MNDNINRQQALDTIRNIRAITGTFDDKILLIDKAEAQTALMMLPPAEPRKRGKWILGKIETGAFNLQYQYKRCSECGWESSLIIPRNFCPNCGTDMRGE